MKSLTVALSICLASASVCMSQTIQDDFSNPASWTTIQYDTLGTETVQIGNGVMSVLDTCPSGCSVIGVHLYQGAQIRPAVVGAIDTLTFSIEYSCSNASNPPCFGEGQAFGLVLQQNGNLYFPTNPLDTSITNGFVTTGPVNYTASSFALGISLDTSQQPDFSAEGSPITVGFYTANSDPPTDPGYSIPAGYSNFSVTSNPLCPVTVVPYPSLPFSGDELPTTMNAVFSPGSSSVSLTTAAAACGFTGFNWQQQITTLTAPSGVFPLTPSDVNPANLGSDGSMQAPPSFFDPVDGGGYTYQSPLLTGYSDNAYPFYYDSGELAVGAVGCTKSPAIETANTLRFQDCPNVLNPPVSFTTSLVGVLPSGEPSAHLFTWTWVSTLSSANTGGVYQTKSIFPVDPNSGTGGVRITSVNGIPSPPIIVSPSARTISASEPLSVGITVSQFSGQPEPAGTVTLSSGTYKSTATTLNNGTANITIPAGSLPAGSDMLTVVYIPATSISTKYGQAWGTAVVSVESTARVGTTTALAITPNSNLVSGQPITVVATVTPASGTAIPTGTVTFSDPTLPGTATVPLDATGKATYKGTLPPHGTYTLIATYNGSANFVGSVSPPITRTVSPAP